jgi:hypothetical protein
MLLLDLLATTGQEERFEKDLLALVRGQRPPPADWAILRACRLDGVTCDAVAATYVRRNPTRWLANFWAMRHSSN